MKKKLAVLLVLMLAVMSAVVGCGGTSSSGERTVTDMTGAEVTLPAEVNSVINCWPSSNQIMITLGATDKQTAYFQTLQSPSFTWMQIVNPAIVAEDAKLVGVNGSVTAEELLALEPDLVITANADDAEAWRSAGLNAMCMMFNSIDGLKESVTKTAEALGGDAIERAEKYNEYLDGNIAMVEERLADIEDADKPTVYYLDGQHGQTPYATAGTGTIQEEWINIAGGKIATEGVVEGSGKEITAEQLLEIDPDYILVGGLNQATAYDILMNDESLQGLKAIQNNRVYRIPQGTFQWCRYGSETALQVVWTAKTLYPDRFEDIDMKQMTIDFYKDFLDYDLSSEYADAILAGKDSPNGK